MNDDCNIYEEGKVIVALSKNLVHSTAQEYDISHILDGLDYEKTEVIFHSKEESDTGDIILVHLKNSDKPVIIDAVEKLSVNPYVIYAEPNYQEELHIIPNDRLYNRLWGTQKIEAPLAWNYTIGSARVSVGVIDTGIDYNHPDIRRNMWVSPNRWLVNGWNFAGDDCNPMDIDGHGTHVAGTIGAVGNNCIGITGICWNVRVVAMKFGLNIAAAIAAIDFANRFNIPILNASWGGRSFSRALKYAIDQYNGLFIASAGNNGTNNDLIPLYPACYDCDNIISVAATNPDNTKAGFSNFGVKSVDIAAPGTDILSLALHGKYTSKNGTSMSAPHVAGAAALLKGCIPDLSALQLKNIILSSAVKHPNLSGLVSTGGILNVNAMFEMAKRLMRNR